MPSSIEISDLTKRYGQFVSLDNVSLSVSAGEFLTLLGPSGSGKTTLLMSIAGFTRPDAGSIRIDNKEIVALPPHKRNIGMVFQNYALFPHMTVAENVGYPLKLRGVGKAERDQRITAALAAVQMDRFASRNVAQLSGGQRQRVAVARAIVFEPNIILMDEPLSALDKKLREEMQVELKHLQVRLGRTVVYVTHDQKEALTMSDRIAVMRAGKIEQVATPKDIYEAPASKFVADFIGDSDFVPASVVLSTGDHALARNFLQAKLGSLRDPIFVLRPEKIEIDTGADVGPGALRLSGTVQEVLYQGNALVAYIALESGQVIRLQRGTRTSIMESFPQAGSPVRILVHEKDICIVEQEELAR